MMQDGKAMKLSVPTDLDGMGSLLAGLRDDVTRLTGSVTTLAERRGRKMAADISDTVTDAVHTVERRGKSVEADVERSIAMHPFIAMGLSAGFGLLIGVMMRRR